MTGCVLVRVVVLVGAVALGITCRGRETPASFSDPELDQARKVYFEQGAKPALPLFEQLLARYQASGNARGAAIVVGLLGNVHKRLGDLQKAEAMLLQALREKQSLGDVLEEGRTRGHLGLLYWDRADYPQAISYLNQSLSIGLKIADREMEGAALNNLGLVFQEQGDYGRSTEHFTRAVELHRATGFARGESDALGNLGGVQLALGRYREALSHYERALAISERLLSKVQQSQDLGNIALCHLRLGDVGRAMEGFTRALALAEEAGLAKEQADWRKGRASALLKAGRHDQALAEYALTTQSYERAGLRRELVAALLDTGRLLLEVGDTAEAARHFERAQALAQSIGYATGVKRAALALGDIDLRRRQFADAAGRFRQAYERAAADKDRATAAAAGVSLARTALEQGSASAAGRDAGEALLLAREIGARATEAAALLALGDAARLQRQTADALARYREADAIAAAVGDADLRWRIAYAEAGALEAQGDMDAAVAALLRAASIIEEVRNRLSGQRFRAAYLGDKSDVYTALVRVLLALRRPADAFAYAERLRAQSYFELIAAGPARALEPRHRQAEADLRARIRRLQDALQEERERTAERRRGEAVAAFSSELDAAERAYSALIDELRQADPAQAAVRVLETPSVQTVQQSLAPRTALVEYVIADQSLAVFVVTPAALQAVLLPISRADLTSRVELLRDLLAREGDDRWRRPAGGLFAQLVAPLQRAGWLQDISSLVIVPHGVLHYVPFATLVDASRESRFLVEDFSLSMAPAAAAVVRPRHTKEARELVLAAAPARARLPFAPEEARRVVETAGAGHLLLLGGDATERVFKQRAADYRVIHLATHGFFNRTNPLLSGVELEADREDDGRLQVFEILGLALNADLVTLSACDTAMGAGLTSDLPAGEEFVGLTRAFLTAGSRSVLASLWEINDRATAGLMAKYYRQARNGTYAQALAEAQRAALATGTRASHPYFWAPFVLVGG